MRINIRLWMFALIFSLPIVNAQAADHNPSTLDGLVKEALTNNPQLDAARAQMEQFAWKVPQAGSLDDPVLSLSFSNYPNDSLARSETAMTGDEVRLAQKFPFPGKRASRELAAREQSIWYEALYQNSRHQLVRKVRDSWFLLNYYDQAIAVTERNLGLLDDVVRLTEVRYETGSGLQQDVLKAQVEHSRLMQRLISLKQQRTTTQAELNTLLDRPYDSPHETPSEVVFPARDLSLADYQRIATELHPMNKAYAALTRRYQQQQRLARLDDYPDMTLWAGWRFRDNGLDDNGTDFVSAGVSVNLPVYREKRQAAKAEAAAALRMAKRQTEDYINRVEQAVHAAYQRMQETAEQAALYREGIIPQSSQNFAAALSSYQVGKVEFISLLDALKGLHLAELEYYRVSSEYYRSVARLEAETGLADIGSSDQATTILLKEPRK